jgi:exodeoxyribonuclease VII large subunit
VRQAGSKAVIEAPGNPGVRPLWGVAALLLAVSDTLSARFGALSVRGELSGLTRAASGHLYFSLKDADGAPGLIRCAMFRRAAVLVDFAPADGQRVDVRGRVAVYEPRGELQFLVESLQRVGAGTLYEEFLRRRARLAAEGLFDESRRRPVTRHPRAIGVVTSLGAAALHDVATALARRAPQVRLVVYPSLVQGADAPAALVAALVLAAARHEVETLLLVRGGGSLEDLWAFNDERVVRAVAACTIPVVCGVGHESDITLCDLAADLRAATPTAAAELASPPRQALLDALAAQQQALRAGTQRAIERQAQRVDQLARRAGRPSEALYGHTLRLAGFSRRLGAALALQRRLAGQALPMLARRLLRSGRESLLRRAERLRSTQGRLESLHPQHVLQRGYAWVVDAEGRPVMRAARLQLGDLVEAVFADGSAEAQVREVRLRDNDGVQDG